MTITSIRDVVAQHLRGYFAEQPAVKITTEYTPVIEAGPDDIVLAVQPVSLTVSYADRARLATEPKISITVTRRIGEDRQIAGDTVLAIVGDIVKVLDTYRDGSNVVKALEIADPIIAEDTLSGANVAASRIVVSLYGQQTRGGK